MSALTPPQVLDLFRQTGTLKEGHFLLTSGRHSDRFFLMPHTFQFPAATAALCAALAERYDGVAIETVVGPATGGIILAYEVARQLGLRRPADQAPRAIFTEKTDDGKMALKRQWSLRPGERVLVVEDAITTGGSVAKTLDALGGFAPELVGVGCLADRSGGAVRFPAPLTALIVLDVASWAPEECPLCRQGLTLARPKA